MNEHTNIDYANMPSSYMMCFNTACPKAETCLHLMAGANLPATYTCGLAIYPNMQTGENGCKFFDEAQPKQMAWGFSALFEIVRYRDAKRLREAMKKLLGCHTNYYRYNRGEKLLNPKQQEQIRKLFRKYGYDTGVEFDHYVTTYDFKV